jgi:hypothetical protein
MDVTTLSEPENLQLAKTGATSDGKLGISP